MIDDTVRKIEARIENAAALKSDHKTEMLALLATLKSEIAVISHTHSEEAQSIAGFTEISTHEATRLQKNPALLKLSIEGLSSSARGFEQSHPKLVEIVNAICVTLSSLGI